MKLLVGLLLVWLSSSTSWAVYFDLPEMEPMLNPESSASHAGTRLLKFYNVQIDEKQFRENCHELVGNENTVVGNFPLLLKECLDTNSRSEMGFKKIIGSIGELKELLNRKTPVIVFTRSLLPEDFRYFSSSPEYEYSIVNGFDEKTQFFHVVGSDGKNKKISLELFDRIWNFESKNHIGILGYMTYFTRGRVMIFPENPPTNTFQSESSKKPAKTSSSKDEKPSRDAATGSSNTLVQSESSKRPAKTSSSKDEKPSESSATSSTSKTQATHTSSNAPTIQTRRWFDAPERGTIRDDSPRTSYLKTKEQEMIRQRRLQNVKSKAGSATVSPKKGETPSTNVATSSTSTLVQTESSKKPAKTSSSKDEKPSEKSATGSTSKTQATRTSSNPPTIQTRMWFQAPEKGTVKDDSPRTYYLKTKEQELARQKLGNSKKLPKTTAQSKAYSAASQVASYLWNSFSTSGQSESSNTRDKTSSSKDEKTSESSATSSASKPQATQTSPTPPPIQTTKWSDAPEKGNVIDDSPRTYYLKTKEQEIARQKRLQKGKRQTGADAVDFYDIWKKDYLSEAHYNKVKASEAKARYIVDQRKREEEEREIRYAPRRQSSKDEKRSVREDDNTGRGSSVGASCGTMIPDMRANNFRNNLNISYAVAQAPASQAFEHEVPNYLWNAGQTLRIRFLNGNNDFIKNKIKEVSEEWTNHANLKFDFVDSGPAEIRIKFDDSAKNSESNVGRNTEPDQNLPTMRFLNFNNLNERNFNEIDSGTILHEFGHALGLLHEHQHPLAEIDWDKDAAYDYYKKTQKWEKTEVDSYVFEKYSMAHIHSEYDEYSVMVYPIPKGLTKNEFSSVRNNKLSEGNKNFISKLYPPESVLAGRRAQAFAEAEAHSWNWVDQQTGTWGMPRFPPLFGQDARIGFNYVTEEYVKSRRQGREADRLSWRLANYKETLENRRIVFVPPREEWMPELKPVAPIPIEIPAHVDREDPRKTQAFLQAEAESWNWVDQQAGTWEKPRFPPIFAPNPRLGIDYVTEEFVIGRRQGYEADRLGWRHKHYKVLLERMGIPE